MKSSRLAKTAVTWGLMGGFYYGIAQEKLASESSLWKRPFILEGGK